MIQLYTTVMLSLLLALVLSPASPDALKVERFLRYYYNWPEAAVNVKIGEFKPAPIKGLFQTLVELSDKAGQKAPAMITFYVSEDGRYVMEGPALSTNDPYKEIRESIELSKQPSYGAVVPKITIVEYSDFQCDYCRQMSAVLKEVQREFGTQIRVYFKEYPLRDIHPWAGEAAVIGRCVLKQDEDAFWEYHDWVFGKHDELTLQNLPEKVRAFLAGKKKVDRERFDACLKAPEARTEVDRSVKEAQTLGIASTPTLFVNGRRLVGSQTVASLRQVILLELERLKQIEGTVQLRFPPR